MRLSVILAAILALAIGLPASATPPETPPPATAKYVMVVWEPGTPLPGKDRKLAPREVPDVVRLGGRVLMSNQNQYVIYLPHVYAGGMLAGGEVQEWGYTETYEPIPEDGSTNCGGGSASFGNS